MNIMYRFYLEMVNCSQNYLHEDIYEDHHKSKLLFIKIRPECLPN